MPTRDSPQTVTLCAAALLGARSEVTLPELREALEASAAAGFSAISLWAVHHQALVAGGMDPDELVALHHEAGLSVPVVEAALGWAKKQARCSAVKHPPRRHQGHQGDVSK